MPQRVVCQKCGFILYEDIDLKAPDEVIQQYDGKCPSCGKKLAVIPESVDITPVE